MNELSSESSSRCSSRVMGQSVATRTRDNNSGGNVPSLQEIHKERQEDDESYATSTPRLNTSQDNFDLKAHSQQGTTDAEVKQREADEEAYTESEETTGAAAAATVGAGGQPTVKTGAGGRADAGAVANAEEISSTGEGVPSNCQQRAQRREERRQPKQQEDLLRHTSKTPWDPPASYKRGELPRYLQARREDARRSEEERASRDPNCPPDHNPLPDTQRRATLALLHHSVQEVMSALGRLPVASDSLRLRRHRQQLEQKLDQLDEGIRIFSQPKVYVLNDEDEG